MPAADWTSISNGSGAFSILADATAPSPPDVMNISAGGQYFQNITAGTFKNSRISAWARQNSTGNNNLLLALRSINTTFSANPATYFQASVNTGSATTLQVTISAIVAGAVTNIVNNVTFTTVNGDPQNTWQQYQFSAFNSGANILLRFSMWNGAAFVPISDAAAPIASFPALDVAGSCRFGGLISSGTVRIDDVNYYSLA